MSDVYVVGTDMIKFGRFPERTVEDLGAEAALLALTILSPEGQAILARNGFKPAGLPAGR